MSRDLEDTNYYVSQGGKVPVKWTAPEVRMHDVDNGNFCNYHDSHYRIKIFAVYRIIL